MDSSYTSPKSSVINNSIFKKVMQARMVAMFVVMALLSTTAFSSTASASSIQDFLNAASASAANLFGFSTENSFAAQQSQSANNSTTSNTLNFASAVDGDPTQQTAIATVTTDRTDYNPGETVIITGSGFAPYDTVSLEIKREGALAAISARRTPVVFRSLKFELSRW